MSRGHARFLADHDLNDAIVVGVRRREPAAEIARLRDLDLATQSDPEVLDFAARENWIVISHDFNTMGEAAWTRVAAGLPMNASLWESVRAGSLTRIRTWAEMC